MSSGGGGGGWAQAPHERQPAMKKREEGDDGNRPRWRCCSSSLRVHLSPSESLSLSLDPLPFIWGPLSISQGFAHLPFPHLPAAPRPSSTPCVDVDPSPRVARPNEGAPLLPRVLDQRSLCRGGKRRRGRRVEATGGVASCISKGEKREVEAEREGTERTERGQRDPRGRKGPPPEGAAVMRS